MIDLLVKQKPSELKKAEEGPAYPYWANFSIDDMFIRKFGLDFDKLDLGQKVYVIGEGSIESLEKYSTINKSEPRKILRIQIKKMSIKPETQQSDKYNKFKSKIESGPNDKVE